MKYLLMGIACIIGVVLMLIKNILLMIWHLRINPVIKKGVQDGYYHEEWDVKLWDEIFNIRRKPY